MKINQTRLSIFLLIISAIIFVYKLGIIFPVAFEKNFTLELSVKGEKLDTKTSWYFLSNSENGILSPVLFRKNKENDRSFSAFYFKENKVLIEGYIERPGLYVLTNNELNVFFAFMIDTAYQCIEIEHQHLFQRRGMLEAVPFKFSGSLINNELVKFWKEKEAQQLLEASKSFYKWLDQSEFSDHKAKHLSSQGIPRDTKRNEDQKQFALQQKRKLSDIKSLQLTRAVAYLMNNPNSYLALDYFLAYVYRPNFSKLDEATLGCYISLFGDRLKKTKVYKSIVKKYKATQNFCVGKTPPPIELPNIKGEAVKLTEYKGKLTLVHFWEIDCPYCKDERANLLKLYNKYHHNEFDIVSISFDTNKNEWKNFLRKSQIPWQQLIDTTGYTHSSIIEAYGIASIPNSFLLDEGKVLAYNLKCPAYADEPKYNINKQLEKIFGF